MARSYYNDMATHADSFGICRDLYRQANQESFDIVAQELIGNRTHNTDKGPVKFLFAQCTIDGMPHFIYGSTQFRTQESIENEHRVFNFNEKKGTNEAQLGTRGFGAKLFPFKIGGTYGVWFRIHNEPVFSDNPTEWGLREDVHLSSLINDINSDNVRDNNYILKRYSDTFHVPSTSIGKGNTLNFTPFANTDLFQFIKDNNFKYFQVFYNYDMRIHADFDDCIRLLAKYYETNDDVSIYTSRNMDAPRLVSFDKKTSFGLCPSDWIGEFHLDWKLGNKHDSGRFWENQFRWVNPINNKAHYGIISSNGSIKSSKFNRRTKSYVIPENQVWEPDVRVIIPITIQELANPDNRQVWMFIQDDLISHTTGSIGLLQRFNHMGPYQSRTKCIIKILTESIKENPESGLNIEGVKRKSTIKQKSALSEMIEETIKLATKFFREIISKDATLTNRDLFTNDSVLATVPAEIEMDKKHAAKCKERKKKGMKFEQSVKDFIIENSSDEINWENNDTDITARYDLGENQGIDMLGSFTYNTHTIRIAAQMKDKEATIRDDDKFVRTLKALKDKFPNDVFFSYLVVKQIKSINGQLCRKMTREDIVIVFEDGENAGEQLLEQITRDLTKFGVIDSI